MIKIICKDFHRAINIIKGLNKLMEVQISLNLYFLLVKKKKTLYSNNIICINEINIKRLLSLLIVLWILIKPLKILNQKHVKFLIVIELI